MSVVFWIFFFLSSATCLLQIMCWNWSGISLWVGSALLVFVALQTWVRPHSNQVQHCFYEVVKEKSLPRVKCRLRALITPENEGYMKDIKAHSFKSCQSLDNWTIQIKGSLVEQVACWRGFIAELTLAHFREKAPEAARVRLAKRETRQGSIMLLSLIHLWDSSGGRWCLMDTIISRHVELLFTQLD